MREIKSINNKNLKDVLKVYMYDKYILPAQFRNISTWKTKQIKDMRDLFKDYPDFNEPLNDWDVIKVESMTKMFAGCTNFNQPLNNWNVANVIAMNAMFSGCTKFNQPLDKWKLSSVVGLEEMFKNCEAFNQPLNNWDEYITHTNNLLHMPTVTTNMFLGCGISEENKPASLQQSHTPQSRSRTQLTIKNWFENKGIVIYQSIQPVPLEVSTEMAHIDPTATAFDPIMYDDINVYDYLREDTDNVIFEFDSKFYPVSKSTLINLCSDYSAVKYECLNTSIALIPTDDNLNKTNPYLMGKSFNVLCGLIELSKIKTIIETPEIRVVQIVDFAPPQNAMSTASTLAILIGLKNNGVEFPQLSSEEQKIVRGFNLYGASHCQEGQDEKIRDVKILPTPDLQLPTLDLQPNEKRKYTGGRKKTRREKNFRKQTKKIKCQKNKTRKIKKNY
jgi:surface protein